ncbi:hypothetical protein E2C01_092316 [Portunus trituberculatus]|uniref:Uncharacterized protein n=1 Tax=Portunus trituberculatus TaxID=210409 RepID=A0A5B7JVG7_PORTR|nr:hypothetical protein [Portunus trituberculatus]
MLSAQSTSKIGAKDRQHRIQTLNCLPITAYRVECDKSSYLANLAAFQHFPTSGIRHSSL